MTEKLPEGLSRNICISIRNNLFEKENASFISGCHASRMFITNAYLLNK